jgi:hypothetical protein
VIACLTLLAAGLVGLLLVNVSLESGSYQLQDQKKQATALTEQREALLEQLDALQAPQHLAASAAALGMVPARNAAFLRASDGRILGVPAPGVAAPKPAATRTTAVTKAGAGQAGKATVPVTKKPATKKPVARKPATKKPATKKPSGTRTTPPTPSP